MYLFIVLISMVIFLIVGYVRTKYTYWAMRGVKQLQPHFSFGNIAKLKSMHLSEFLDHEYQAFRGKAKIIGTYIFTKPIAIVIDLDLVKTILIKDFNNFIDRTDYRNESKDPLSAHLFFISGEKWRSLRAKLSPTFTSGKMKVMFPAIVSVAKNFETSLRELVLTTDDGIIDFHDIFARYTTDVIGTCIFGIECNSLKNPNAEFRQIGRLMFNRKLVSVRWRLFKETYENFFSFLGYRRYPQTFYHFIMRIVTETVSAREKYNIKRNDFINLLIDLRNNENGDYCLSIEQIAAQVFVFFFAGYETSSSNMSYCVFELAKNPHVQEKLRDEILQVLEKNNGKVTYEATMEMTYLGQVITETLRKYPALASLVRFAKEDYKVPGTNIVLEKQTKVIIPVKAIHNDPDIFTNPEEFRPERFGHDELKILHPQAFLGFGDGPRNCIGLRFARMQVRIGLVTLLKSFRVSVSSKTPSELQIGSAIMIMVPANGVWLRVDKL